MKVLITVCLALIPIVLTAQKRVLSLPFEFEKKMLANSDYDVYFLDNKSDQVVSLILKDNHKAAYVQLDKNFNIVSRIDLDLNSTVFNADIADYRGGTTNGNVFNFIYQEKDKKGTGFQLETIDYNTKKVTHRSLFEIPKTETVVSSFSDNNIHYTVTADDKAKELIFYIVTGAGVITQKRIPFTVPEIAGKKQVKLSEYLNNLRFFKSDEEPDLSAAISSAKVFSAPGSLTFIINKEGQPVHLFNLQLPDLSVKESFVDVSSFRKDPKEKIYINSFKKGDLLFSLILNKQCIQLAVHKEATGELVGKQEINEECNFNVFAQSPVSEKRMWKLGSDKKDIDDIKKLIKALNQGTEGIMVTENGKGQYIVTIGTFNLTPMHSEGSSGGWSGGFRPTVMTSGPSASNSVASSTTVMKYDSHMYVRPGTSSYTNARYYTSTYFRLLLDGTGTKYVKGKAPAPVSDQIKDYLEEADPAAKAKATNQFSIGERQFYGHYDKDAKAYVIEEIQIRK